MYWGSRPYVSAAKKRASARRKAQQLEKQGSKLQPVRIEGRKIVATFWGKAWCDNLERYSDFANRLPRGRTYARNGSIIDLQIHKGQITAIVQGSDTYNITIDLKPFDKKDWKKITQDCSQSIHSLLDLLQGRLSDGVMERLVRPREGLFPRPNEIQLHCSCPDWADMCKHVAAVLYGVGARLDQQPDLLFLLRQVDHTELIHQAAKGSNLQTALGTNQNQALQNEDLGELFGIEIDQPAESRPARSKRPAKKKAAKTKATKTKLAQTIPAKTTPAKTKAAKATPVKAKSTGSQKKRKAPVTATSAKVTRVKKTQAPTKKTQVSASSGRAKKVAPPKSTKKVSPAKSASRKPAATAVSTPARSPKKAVLKPASKRKVKSTKTARHNTRKS